MKELSNNYAISWDIIFNKLAFFEDNRTFIYNNTNELDDWINFLNYLKYIENNIPSYQENAGLIDNHSNWAIRVFRMFGRAELEERAIMVSDFQKKYKLNRNSKIKDIGIFHVGRGDRIPDLVDILGNTYDVKHDNIDLKSAHGANNIIKYCNSGTVELWAVDKNSNLKFKDAIEYASIRKLCANLKINYILFDPSKSETDIEEYLLYNYIK